MLCLDPLRGGDDLAVVGLEGGNMGDEVIFATGPIFTGIAGHVYLFEIGQFGQTNDAVVKFSDINKIDSHVQFLQALAAFDVLDSANIVEGQVEVL